MRRVILLPEVLRQPQTCAAFCGVAQPRWRRTLARWRRCGRCGATYCRGCWGNLHATKQQEGRRRVARRTCIACGERMGRPEGAA